MKTYIQIFVPGVVILSVIYFLFFANNKLNNSTTSQLISAGSTFATSQDVPEGIYISPDSDGYDGQFYYRLALDPFTNKQCDFGICFDAPKYRQQRILYPLLVNILSGGQIDKIPWLMVLTNMMGVTCIAILGGIFANHFGFSYSWGLVFSLYIGLWFSLLKDLTEITEVLCMLAGLVMLVKNRHLESTFLLSLAVLARETAIILAGSILVVACFQRWKYWYTYLFPWVVYGVWQIWLSVNWQISTQIFMLQIPMVEAVKTLYLAFVRRDFWGLLFIPAGCVLIVIVILNLKKSGPSYLKLAWIVYTCMILSLDQSVWVGPLAYVRVASDWFMVSVAFLLSANRRYPCRIDTEI